MLFDVEKLSSEHSLVPVLFVAKDETAAEDVVAKNHRYLGERLVEGEETTTIPALVIDWARMK